MSKAARDKELAVVLLCQFNSHMLAVCGAPFANINSHIKHRSFHAAHQFALRIRRFLKVQATHDAITGHRFIVLHEVYCMPQNRRNLLIKLTPRKTLKEIASLVTKDFGLYD